MNPDQTAPKGGMTWVHNICIIDYQSIQADEKAAICREWHEQSTQTYNMNSDQTAPKGGL